MAPLRVALLLALSALALPALATAQEEGGYGLGAPAPAAGDRAPDPVAEVPAPPGAIPPPPDTAPPAYGSEAGGARYPAAPGLASEGVRIPSRVATRLRVLDADFNALASRGGNHIVDGILSIVVGGLAVTLGIYLLSEDIDFLPEYLFVYGGAGIARGIIDLALMPDARDTSIAFSHMPMGSMDEVEARLAFGERELESMADRTRLARILESSINIGAGVAIVPLYLGPKNFEIDVFGTFILIGAGISVISGVINLLTRSEAERRWDAYQQLARRLEGEERADALRLFWGLGPVEGGGAATVGATF